MTPDQEDADRTIEHRAKACLDALMDIGNGRARTDDLPKHLSEATWILATIANERPDTRIRELEAEVARLKAGPIACAVEVKP